MTMVLNRVRFLAVGVAVLVATGMAGCATTAGGVPGDLQRSLESASSAVQSGILALEQVADGRTLTTAGDVGLSDALTQVNSEVASTNELDVSTPREQELRETSADALSEAATALASARAVVAGASEKSAPEADGDLKGAADAITEALGAIGEVR